MAISPATAPAEPSAREFHADCLRTLDAAGVQYLVGGSHALAHHTARGHDAAAAALELYVRPDDHRPALNALVQAGYRAEYVDPRWLARVLDDADDRVDLIYGSRNGLCAVDDDWFTPAGDAAVLGQTTRVCPAEELLWCSAFAQDADDYRGADVAHLILARGNRFDWQRLLRRFTGHERVLLAHCILFAYVYPTDAGLVPDRVLDHLHAAARDDAPPAAKLCRGSLLARRGYENDVTERGYADGRVKPYGPLTEDEAREPPTG